MKKFFLLGLVGLMSLMSNVAQGQKELSLIGEESKKVEADMMMNARYLGSLEGLDIWLTKSDEGVKGLANKRDWHVVKFGDELVPMERADLPLTDHCRVLGAVGFEQNASGIHKASVLLVDSSARGKTTILRAKLKTDPLSLEGMDTVDNYTYGRKDLCKVWGAVSPNGRYLAVLTIVQYRERKDYISVTKVFDENLDVVWAKDYAVGATEALYVDDNGTVYTMGLERTSNGMCILTNVMDQAGANSYRTDKQCDPIHDMQIANVIGGKVLCLGLVTMTTADPDEDVTSGVVTMVFDRDSGSMQSFKMRFFQNEDKNIFLNKNTKKVQREQDMPMIAPLGCIRMPYGTVVASGHRHHLRYVNANGTVTDTYYGRGIHLIAFDTLGNVKWVRNLRRNDKTDIADEMLELQMFAVGDKAYVLKNEDVDDPEEYVITEEADEYEVGDKSNLVLYELSADGEVSKTFLERKTKHALASMGHRMDGSWVLLSFRGSKCRMAVLK